MKYDEKYVICIYTISNHVDISQIREPQSLKFSSNPWCESSVIGILLHRKFKVLFYALNLANNRWCFMDGLWHWWCFQLRWWFVIGWWYGGHCRRCFHRQCLSSSCTWWCLARQDLRWWWPVVTGWSSKTLRGWLAAWWCLSNSFLSP